MDISMDISMYIHIHGNPKNITEMIYLISM